MASVQQNLPTFDDGVDLAVQEREQQLQREHFRIGWIWREAEKWDGALHWSQSFICLGDCKYYDVFDTQSILKSFFMVTLYDRAKTGECCVLDCLLNAPAHDSFDFKHSLDYVY